MLNSRQYLSRLSDRDRRALLSLLCFGAVFAAYQWGWLPLAALHTESYERYQESREHWNILKSQESHFQSAGGSQQTWKPLDPPAIMSKAQTEGLPITLEITMDQKLSGHANGASITQLLQWFTQMQQAYGTSLESFSITRSAQPNQIDAIFVLNPPLPEN